jgi:VWFA-related protein
VALVLAMGSTGVAQTLPPGQLPPGPPPQPGQLGPAKPTAPSTDSAASGDVPAVAGSTTIPGVTTQYVLVPTSVFDPDRHGYVNGLTANQFELYDNDKLQKITAEFTEQPVSIVLVVQANSEIEPVLPQLKKTGLLFHGLVTGQDGDVAVLAFDHRLQLLQDFTNDPSKLDDSMQKLTAGSSSARLIDAVLDADHMLKRHDPRNVRRRVIVLISRNIDKGSESHLQETVRSMQFDNVIIYCIDISRVLTAVMTKPGYPRPQNGGVPPEALPHIAGGTGPLNDTNVVQQEDGNWLSVLPPIGRGIHDIFQKTPAEAFAYFTGGRVYSFAKEKTLESAISDIGADLNSQYLLSYRPNDKNEPGFHNIRVVVNGPGLKIRARPGYWWGGGAAQ